MKLHVINTGLFKLDGGAMFGVVPKTMWSKLVMPDENNMCTWAMRCLLIEDGDRLMLIDNGIGTKQDAKFFSHYYLHGSDTLTNSLKQAGFSPADVTDVFLTHLHFDHCGGSVNINSAGKAEMAFPNAIYWSNQSHWDWATMPNPREKASFLKENILPIQESGQLQMVTDTNRPAITGLDIITVNGHTEKQMLPLLNYKDYQILFCGDLFPSYAHLPLPFVMGYDTRPLLTMAEKQEVLERATNNPNFVLFYEHDAQNECGTVKKNEKGGYLSNTVFSLSELG
jgi:glyoxylase-like metal-dependent hydrolase (beta-lactamase superfamily II)